MSPDEPGEGVDGAAQPTVGERAQHHKVGNQPALDEDLGLDDAKPVMAERCTFRAATHRHPKGSVRSAVSRVNGADAVAADQRDAFHREAGPEQAHRALHVAALDAEPDESSAEGVDRTPVVTGSGTRTSSVECDAGEETHGARGQPNEHERDESRGTRRRVRGAHRCVRTGTARCVSTSSGRWI
ncbi:hypothetical protein [Streptomyces tailanensis]|uniref:hypothetical protein n=1 Tax=Streptomyces tailanensis TaxID=2569858 RepID=UPI00122E06A1|nr:hypothetical protein [Streptomyces tailanensis]